MSQLSEPDQQSLLQIARESVQSHLVGKPRKLDEVSSAALTELRAVFVSIHKDLDLRGCIGNLHPAWPLYRTTAECAVSAAVGDPRFIPLSAPEMPEVTFEISVLSPFEQLHTAKEIEIGTHGLLVVSRNNRGLLLPQVAHRYRWDADRFISEACRKAGLQENDWTQDAVIYRFTAEIFGEQHIHHPANT